MKCSHMTREAASLKQKQIANWIELKVASIYVKLAEL